VSSLLSHYDYQLPGHLIADRPLPTRDASRMLVLHRDSGRIEHRRFVQLPEFVQPGDLLVLNNTRVVPARRYSDDGKIEFLFVDRIDALRWKCLVKPGRRMRVGASSTVGGVAVQVEAICPDGERIVRADRETDLQQGGVIPLPPYLGRASDIDDEKRYQTVFNEVPGAVAAPTAGLHFTPALLEKLPHAFVTLHVGPGTFRPVQSENLEDHRMHAEQFQISADAAATINAARRVLAIGTTTVRVLESATRIDNRLMEQVGETDIFIRPPYRFRAVDMMLTNFHLPRSTLLMLVSAFAGRELVLEGYRAAIAAGYRFYSYGDCMLIL
jgi:S-adenosylmethionine:tRNA ribosyltransferase-isomerase